jgi:two-component system sensor histidine kinase/response regulator FitF
MEETNEAAAQHDAGRLLEPETHFPDKLPGVAIKRTLDQMDMTGPTLVHILSGFLADNRDTCQKIRQAQAANDMESMGQLAHGLKGSAANIGADDLSKAAQELEQSCLQQVPGQGEPSDLEGKITSLESALGMVLRSIQALEKSGAKDEATPAAPGTDLPLEALLDRLAAAIERSDPEQIMKIMPDIRKQAVNCKHISLADLKALEAQINLYDYDPAMETLRKIRKNTQGDI